MRLSGGRLVALVEIGVEATQQIDLPRERRRVAGRIDEVEPAHRIVHRQRLMVGSEEAAAERLLRAAADGDEVGQRHIALAEFLRDDRAEAGERHRTRAVLVAGVQVVRRELVIRFQRAHAAQDGGVLHQFREAREMLADLNAGNGGFDRLELATHVRGCVGRVVVGRRGRAEGQNRR